MQPKSAPPHTLCAATRSLATTRASPDNCGTEPAADEANPPTRRSIENEHYPIRSAPHHHNAAPDLPGRQPGLDADRIDLYRHHRCLRALQRGTPQAGQDFSGVPRTHQFLVTLTVHTDKIKPATTPTATSAEQ